MITGAPVFNDLVVGKTYQHSLPVLNGKNSPLGVSSLVAASAALGSFVAIQVGYYTGLLTTDY
jgi:hypothetical protein